MKNIKATKPKIDQSDFVIICYAMLRFFGLVLLSYDMAFPGI